MRGITKRFPGVVADDNVDFSVKSGEIHALMGENGAGKSILMSILAGLYQPDAGEIYLRGKKVHNASPLGAIDGGIGMLFQSFKLLRSLSYAKYVVSREERFRGPLIDRAAAYIAVAEISERYNLTAKTDAEVASMPVGVLKRVEFIRALYPVA